MLHRRWREAMVAVALVSAALGGGCSDGAEPSTLPDVTPTTSDSAEPTSSPETAEPTPSTDPTSALEAEVEDFIRTYIDTLNESWTSPDALARRLTMFADECEICRYGYDVTEDAHERGLTFRGEPSALVDVDVLEVDQERAAVLVMSDVPAGQLVDSSGEVVETFEPNLNAQRLYDLYRREGEGWIVVRIEVL